ncbi:taurine---2-oxoglutarate transaminase [Natronorubrum sediminis]|uniref:Taurine---2-oxoglutarate transaminase n=1 Tax=Natronorubrum sediminis TaxID=640943 RepID=A0A1H6FU79_9EURY|nr:aminotransferase class III-fold pyridoxal phosphate-dependent enzyme [Natronorubrum sediminis]SEH13513.1 taurine---2-oxoglutarate transaminase [Natronorubrum sediminis]
MAMERLDSETETTPTAIPHWYDGDDDIPTIVDGEDVTVYDSEGTAYLDFQSQLYCVNAGHSNQQIIDAIADQLARIPYVSSGKHNDTRNELRARLLEVAPESMAQTLFSISGSEANETAVMLAREYADASKVLTRWHSYHGATYGMASLTGDTDTRAYIEPHATTTGNAKFLPPIPEAFDAETPEELAEKAANHLEFVIRNEGPDTIAALLTEVVAGSSGAYTAPPGYFERVREICDEYDILLIADEVITGFGRTGEWFGAQSEGIQPDLMTFAKGLTSSYVPLAGVMMNDDLAEYVAAEGFDVGQTFAGHPVGCAAALAAMDVYEDGLLENTREVAPRLESRLTDLEERFDVVSSVHGRGLHWGVAFADPEADEPFVDPRVSDEDDNPVETVLSTAGENGALFGMGRPNTQIIVSPPLCVTEAEIDEAVDALEDAIESTF